MPLMDHWKEEWTYAMDRHSATERNGTWPSVTARMDPEGSTLNQVSVRERPIPKISLGVESKDKIDKQNRNKL